MEKKIMISLISLAVVGSLIFLIWSLIDNREIDSEIEVKENNNAVVNISNEEIVDECTEEWDEYNEELQTAFEEANNNIADDETHYLLKGDNGYISVFYLDDNGEEFLYKKTNIATDYLSEEDIDELEIGIEVVGIEEVNKRLEDFE